MDSGFLDIFVACILLICGSVLVAMSYWVGGEPWNKKYRIDAWDKSGLYGEIALVSMTFVGFCIATVMCEDIVAERFFLRSSWEGLSPTALFVAATFIWMAVAYTKAVADTGRIADRLEKKSPGDGELVRNAYKYYNLFALLFYFIAFASVTKIIAQLAVDMSSFAAAKESFLLEHEVAISQLGHDLGVSEARQIEQSFLNYLSLRDDVLSQLEPMIVFCAYVVVMMMVIAFTPLKDVFSGDARKSGIVVSGTGITIVLVLSIVTFFYQFVGFSEDYHESLSPLMQKDFVEISALLRLSEILREVSGHGGLGGFMSFVLEDGGIIVVAVAGLQWVASKLSPDSSIEKPNKN